jgi:hypothetical protein
MRKALPAYAGLLLAVAATEGDAQTRELELRVDSLARIAQRARGAVHAHDDSARRIARTLDTAHASAFRVVAERPVIGQTRAIAPIVVDSVRSAVGTALSRLTGFTFRVQVEHHARWGRIGDTTRELVVSIIRPNGAEMRAWRGPVDSASIAASLHHAITYAAFAVPDPALFAWAGNAIPDDTVLVSEWANQRLLLISSASAVGTRCYEGDINACRIALMLSRADPIREWHDSTTRRNLVRRRGELARRMDARAEQQCLAGSDASCIALLQVFPASTFHEPAVVTLRFGLLRHALSLGGAGSTERLLMASAGSPSDRLEAAARMPIDSLIRSWQTRVRETHAPSEDLTFGITIMSLAWAAGMGALSLRSSRWR